MKNYEPKKKKYNDLRSLFREMIDAGVFVSLFDGTRIETKEATYMMYDGQLLVRAHGND